MRSRPTTRRRVGELLWHGERLSRTDLAKRLGMSKAMITNVVSELVARNVVNESVGRAGRQGRAAIPLAFNYEHGLLTGIDLGASNVRIRVTDLRGSVLARRVFETPADASGEELARVVGEVEAQVVHEVASDRRVLATVIGVPGAVRDGTVQYAPNLSGVTGSTFVQAIRRRLDRPLELHNDVNLAALGEASCADTQEGVLVLLSIGTGLGAGVVVDHRVWSGVGGTAGEIGYVPFRSPVGSNLESALSGNGLARLHAHFGGAGNARLALELDDEPARRARDVFLEAFVLALAVVSTTFDPDRIAVGGGVGAALEPCLDTWSTVARSACPVVPKVEISRLPGNECEVGAITRARLMSLDVVLGE